MKKKVDVFIVSLGEDARKWALKTLPLFRENGVSATMDYLDRSMRAQMKDANRENASFTLIVGDNELKEQKFTLRNMKESEEAQLTIDEILSKLSQ